MSSRHRDDYMRRIQDPAIVGPGTWATIHLYANSVITYDQLISFVNFIDVIIGKFPCLKCRDDASHYVRQHPILKSCRILENYRAAFDWSVDFHNYVNQKLNKPIISREEAYHFWSEPSNYTCQEDCGESEEVEKITPQRRRFVPVQ